MVKNGQLSVAEASRQTGFVEYRLGVHDAPSGMFFGKGDKFWEAIGPLSSYLRGWEARGFEFKHLAPKEAARRLKKVEQVEALLAKAKEDIVARADSTKLVVRR
jgi:hypothetical protein